MKTVVLITCTKNKHTGKHRAEYLYTKSDDFVKYLECARAITDNQDIFVISALHKLVPLYKEIEWYDFTLKGRAKEENEKWGSEVIAQIGELYDVNTTKFIIIADEDYYTALEAHLPYMDAPLKGIGCGPQGYEQLDEYVQEFLQKRSKAPEDF